MRWNSWPPRLFHGAQITTILTHGTVCTGGWDRPCATTGAAAKRTKTIINRERIYPRRSGDRREILDAAAPVIQAPPAFFR